HVVTMLDDAVRLAAGLDEPAEDNYVRAHAQADLAEHSDERRSTTRIFGSKPGAHPARPPPASPQPRQRPPGRGADPKPVGGTVAVFPVPCHHPVLFFLYSQAR